MKEIFAIPKHCPACESLNFIRKGYYFVKILRSKKRRYQCKECKCYFSNQTFHSTYYQRRPDLNEKVFQLLVSGNTQQRSAELLKCSPTTVARKLQWLAKYKKNELIANPMHIQIDEMESIEHTKLKPLTIPLCVTDDYKILGITVGKIPAKGHFAELARAKYGPRENEREKVLRELFDHLKSVLKITPLSITTDAHPLYPKLVKEFFPEVNHVIVVSRKMKEKKRELIHNKIVKKIFDPMFALNQRCAKIRSDIRRMTRRSWCTTKNIENLKKHLYLYKIYNNNSIISGS
ncbi:MAG: hypothetical protein WA160_02620 [Pseudobdellovibrio sp.]